MSLTYGFFNSVNGDRKYNAEQMSEYFRGIINEGVYQNLDGGLAVTAGTGLAVSVASGRAIVQNRWVQNSEALSLTISSPSEVYARKDAVVIRLNWNTRLITIAVKTGTPAASPEAPELTRTSGIYEMALAYISVSANATSVTVTDKRSDTTVCGWVSVAQATSGEVDAMLNAMKTGFDGVEYASPVEMVTSCDQKIVGMVDDVSSEIDDVKKEFVVVKSDNLLDTSKSTSGYMDTSGSPHASDSYKYSDLIPVESGKTYSIWYWANGAMTKIAARFLTAYTDGVAVSASGATYIDTYTVPTGINGIVISVSTSAWADNRYLCVVEGSTYIYNPNGEPYFNPYLVVSYNQLPVSRERNYKSADTLPAAGTLRLDWFPTNNKKNITWACKCKFSSFTGLAIGQKSSNGYDKYIKIDSTKVYVCRTESGSEYIIGQREHGLTITDYLSVKMDIDDTGYGHCVILTKGGCDTHDYNMGYIYNGNVYMGVAQDSTDCILNATSKDFNAKIWMFGDSYFGVFANRVIGQLCALGYFKDIYINALPGQSSTGAIVELKKSLQYGRPQFLVWCLGMNDSSASYSSALSILEEICTNLQITLILYRVPTCPQVTANNNAVNAIVEASGHRYIDAFTAVGTDTSGNWISGYLSTDNIHPTEAGAKAIASQITFDFPEITIAGWNAGTTDGIPRN